MEEAVSMKELYKTSTSHGHRLKNNLVIQPNFEVWYELLQSKLGALQMLSI